MRSYILPIADRDPLNWIISEQRTALPEHRKREAEALSRGDRIFLYTTRGCFRNPTRDSGRLIGRALVRQPAKPLPSAIEFDDRSFKFGVELKIETLAAPRGGIELKPLVPRLKGTFPDSAAWAMRMRRALVPVEEKDGELIERLLSNVARPYSSVRKLYQT